MRRPFRRVRYTRRAPWERPWRPRGPLVPGRALNPRVQRELRRANHLMAIGQHLNAAEIFVDIAQRAQDIGIVYPAPMLLMQAAHAYLLGEAYKQSIEQATAGLELLAAQERRGALRHEGNRFIEALESGGRKEDVQHFGNWLQDKMQGSIVDERPSAAHLPEKCPYCGASMSLEQVQAGGSRAAECQYCGSVVLPRSEV
ncbi:MAG: hypothetical protein WEA61_04060 [Anaerolineales bacterium]